MAGDQDKPVALRTALEREPPPDPRTPRRPVPPPPPKSKGVKA